MQKSSMENNEKIIVPPIKCQGIKTKLIPYIKKVVTLSTDDTWIEPFLGSGVVAFNVKPNKAILADKNKYIINFYKQIQQSKIDAYTVREFLQYHGARLEKYGNDYYLKMRTEFNKNGEPLHFLFLNRSGFNGMIRFNKKGEFNIPFCKKNNRFSKAYITKICNQVQNVSKIIKERDWEFIHCDWKESFSLATENDYIYLDPPYIGRDTSYIGEWSDKDAEMLSQYSNNTKANVCLSMWKENIFRKNEHLYKYWNKYKWLEINHFYHVGASEQNRHKMVEVLALKNL
mgnify:CR=1 FL=1